MTAAAGRLVYLVAGEASGDLLGARLMEALRQQQPDVAFNGVGGEKMLAEDLASLFPYSELSIMGFSEIIPHIPRLLKRISQTFEDIRQKQPAAVVTIDSPGFNFRLADMLRKHPETKHIKRIHYVAPTVWAYKPERARKTADLFDHILLLLPFEPPYFNAEGLACTYVGHPIVWEWKTLADKNALRDKYNIAADTKIICMLPGSRKGEINQHLPIFGKTLELLQKQFPQLLPVFVVHPGMRAAVTQATRDWPQKPLILWETDDKKAAFASASIALSKSGTVALELSLAGVPSIITYKVSSYSAWLMRRMVKVRFVNLINILLNKEVVPEMLQEKCAPAPLAEKLQQLLDSPDMQKKQLADAREALSMLGLNDSESPSSRAAKAVLDVIARA